MPKPEVAENIYKDPSYFLSIYGNYFSSKASYKNFKEWLNLVKEYLPDKKCKIAEIGSGSGNFLQVLKDEGYINVQGYEMNDFAVRESRKRGLTVYYQKQFSTNSKFDAVFLFDVIEHVPNPVEFITSIYKCLNFEGMLILETSCNRRLVSRILGKLWWFLIPPNHVIIYNTQSLKKLLSNLNFNIIDSIKINKHMISVNNALVRINTRFCFTNKNLNSIFRDVIFPFFHFTSLIIIAKK